MKRFFGRVAKFVITRISGKPIKEGTEMTVQFEKVSEGENGHKKIKKHHRKNKQPA
jgi:predicted RNA-binding protein with TRAM domain